jgi:hypothetical protein|tara:strand:- start:178 stop:363 length:186 start_codon:yes stop_codon:yes gene_type:complete
MFQHITHPISGILASIFVFMSTLPENINVIIQMVSAFLGLIIAVLSAITAVEKFRNRKKND